MTDVMTVEQIRNAERITFESGVTQTQLRFMAASAVARDIEPRAKAKYVKVAVFCGFGGNGCDGLTAAVLLCKQGIDVTAYIVGERAKMDSATMTLAQCNGVKILPSDAFDGKAGIIIDAIYGIGLNRPIVGETALLIERLNAAKNTFRLAVDIPSGLNADSGEIMGVAFAADATISFTCYKPGMLFGGGRSACGKIIVEDIGVKSNSNMHIYEDADFEPLHREKTLHKGKAGRVYIIGGCGSMVGAPILAGAAAHAACLNGAGLVTVCMPSIHRAATSARMSVSMMEFLDDTPDGFIKFDKCALDRIISKASAIDIGMGMGKTPDLKKILKYLCDNFGGTLVIDADALNAISKDYLFLRDAKPKIIITPHVGEFERLTGKQANVENAVALALEINGVVALKSDVTVITDGEQIRLNTSGTPAMAKGGTGDILGGCIAALSCTFDVLDAVTVACYRNGQGAERAVSSYAEMMLTPRDILNYAEYPELKE